MINTASSPRIGLVGCGRWGSLILRDLKILGAEVHVVTTKSDQHSRILDLGATTVHNDVNDLSEAEGIVIATPTSTHAEVVQSVLSFGVPIFVEKPLTDSLQSAQKINDVANNRVFVMDKWRYHPGVELLRNLVATGELGTVEQVLTIRVQPGMPHTDVDCTWILLPHDLSIALEIFGEVPQIESATARWSNGAVVNVMAQMKFANGISMTSEIGIDAESSQRRISIVGSLATATLAGGWENEVLVSSNTPESRLTTSMPAMGELPLLAELRAFMNYLQGGPPPKSNAEQGAQIVAAISRLHEILI